MENETVVVDKHTQRIRIMKYLQEGKEMSSLDAIHLFGIMRLSARISELKASGFPIRKRWQEEENRYGEKVRFVVYYILKDEAV